MDQMFEIISNGSHTEYNAETQTVPLGSREISLREFIEIYEILPELWDPEDPLYKSKKKSNLALDNVVIVFDKIKPNATRNDVRKKINILRSNYRKELKEILESERSKSSTDDVCELLSWKFHSLKFPKKIIEAVVPLHFNKENLEENTQQDTQEKSFSERDTQTGSPLSAASVSSINKIEPDLIKKTNFEDVITKQNQLLSLTSNYLAEFKKFDCSIRAQNWAYKLNELLPYQQMTINKTINEILFGAELENLKRLSYKIIYDSHDTHPSSSNK